MMFLIVDKTEIEKINQIKPGFEIHPIEYNGHWVVGADLLTDEKNWGHAFEYLKTCEEIEYKK